MNKRDKRFLLKVTEYELLRRKQKFGQFVGGYVTCAKCGKLVDDGGFFKNSNDWGCFDCLESTEKGDKI